MSVVLYHHPMSRAATALWMLEEVGIPYTLRHVELMHGEQQEEPHRRINPMGKLPALEDGDAVVTETAAIGVYLADRYASGRLAPTLQDPVRGAFLRWCFYSPSVIEPCCMAHSAEWEYSPGSAGWGRYDRMLETLDGALEPGPWLLGERFTMADVVLGSTLRFMRRFDMIDARPSISAYIERLNQRPALQAADARNAAIIEEKGLARS